MRYRSTDGPISDEAFIQRVRRYTPRSLIPLVAEAGARFHDQKSWFQNQVTLKYVPWALAEIARASIVFGNNYRKEANPRDLLDCCQAFTSLDDPDLRTGGLQAFEAFMLRLSSQQLSYQSTMREELARSIALFEHTTPAQPPTCLTPGWDQVLFHCSVGEYVAVAFMFWAISVTSQGRFGDQWIENADLGPHIDEAERRTIRRVAETHFIASAGEIRKMQQHVPVAAHPELRRFEFNPLEARPVLTGILDGLMVVPVPGLIVRKVSPLGIYYTAIDQLEQQFTRDLGHLFEAYVGRQLRLMQDATVLPEIVYQVRNGETKSVDWIVLFDDVTLLVEVKSARPSKAVRTGSSEATASLRRDLSKAFRQLDRDAKLIRAQHPAFSPVRHDNPIIGLVVTMEPYHVVNAPVYRDALFPNPSLEIRVCSSYELERLVTISDMSAGRALVNFVNDRASQDSALLPYLQQSNHTAGANRILDDAWAALPWIKNRRDL